MPIAWCRAHAMAAWHGEGRFADRLKADPEITRFLPAAERSTAVRYGLSSEARRYDLPPGFRRLTPQGETPCRVRCAASAVRGSSTRRTDSPYETITVDKLTPIIGAEIGGVDLRGRSSNRQMDEIHRALAENLVIFFRDQHLSHGAAPRFRPQVRRAAHPPGGAAPSPAIPELMIIHADKDSLARQRRGLALRRVVRPRAADGQHPLHQEMPAARRRHAVRQHVRRLRGAVGPHEDLSGRPDRAARRRASIAASTRITASRTRRAIPRPTIRSCAPIR